MHVGILSKNILLLQYSTILLLWTMTMPDKATACQPIVLANWNPCIATLCMPGTVCVSEPDPATCYNWLGIGPFGCQLITRCIPGIIPPVGGYCGHNGEICPPGQVCQWIQMMCIPKGPPRLGCGPVPQP